MFDRRTILRQAGVAGSLALMPKFAFAQADDLAGFDEAPNVDLSGVTVRVGLTTPLSDVRFAGSKQMEKLPFKLELARFGSSPPALEAMNAGSIDVTSGGMGNTLAIAINPGLSIVVASYMNFLNGGIVVPQRSPIQKITDLRGKKLCVVKGSGLDFLTAQMLADEGVKWSDIQPIYLPHADALSAFIGGSIDAWSTWDPSLAIAEVKHGGKLIAVPTRPSFNYYYANLNAMNDPRKRAAIVRYILRDLRGFKWVRDNQDAWSREQGRVLRLDDATAKLAGSRTPKDGGLFVTIDDAVLKQARELADYYIALGVAPKDIKIEQVFDTRFNAWLKPKAPPL